MKKALMIVIIVVVVCTALLTTACSGETAYWVKATQIVNNHIEEGSRPFAEVWIKTTAAIQSGDNTAYEPFFLAVMEYYPYVGDAILELTKLSPPTSDIAKWQHLQLEEWSLRSEALYMYMNCWDYTSGTLIGTNEDLLAADGKIRESQEVGQEAARFRTEILGK